MAQQALSRATGLPVTLPGLAGTVGFTQSGQQTNAPTTTTQTSTSQERTNASVTQASSQLNTTPGALAALEQLITQLSDRPAISEAELDKQYPLAKMEFHPTGGWRSINPRTGGAMTPQEAQKFNAQQQSKREQITREAGTISGGTDAQKKQATERQTEISRNREQQGKYSKDAAFDDANFLINKSIADALEQAMPQIAAGLEGAGTSKSTIASSLTQKAALKGATEGGALGANLAVQYGQLNNQLAGVLEELTKTDPNSPTAMLLQAILGSKGLVSSGVNSQNTSGVSTKTGTVVAETGPQTVNTNTVRNPLIPAPGATYAAPAPSHAAASNPYYAFSTGNVDTEPSTLDSAYQNLFSGADAADALFNPGEET